MKARTKMTPFAFGLAMVLVASATWTSTLWAEEAQDSETAPETTEEDDRGAFVAGGKVGALASFNGLGPHVTGAVELGYILPWLDRAFAVIAAVGYAQPVTSGQESDPRVEGGTYSWHLTQRQLTIQPSVLYRATMLPEMGPGKLVPYVSFGPRIFLLQSETDSDSQTPLLLEQSETSTNIGIGAALGSEYLIGPGGALLEFSFGWAGLDQQITGESHLAALSIWAGYRFML